MLELEVALLVCLDENDLLCAVLQSIASQWPVLQKYVWMCEDSTQVQLRNKLVSDTKMYEDHKPTSECMCIFLTISSRASPIASLNEVYLYNRRRSSGTASKPCAYAVQGTRPS